MTELLSTHANGLEEPEIVVPDRPEEEHRSVLPFPIAGIGASAGGLEAFTALLEKTPVDTGMAFVIISHCRPTTAVFYRKFWVEAPACR